MSTDVGTLNDAGKPSLENTVSMALECMLILFLSQLIVLWN